MLIVRLSLLALATLCICSAPVKAESPPTTPVPANVGEREPRSAGDQDVTGDSAIKEPRETQAAIEESSENAPYLFKVGALGFLRGEGSGNYTYDLTSARFTPGQGMGRLAYRIRPYVEWYPAEWLEMEVEGEGYGFTLGSPRDSQFALYQAYAEIGEPAKKRVTLKIGRQELVYGSTFMLGSNSFFNGLTYDAALLRFQPVREVTLDLFGGSYAVPLSHYFSDVLSGAYLTYATGDDTAVELYYIRDQGPQYTVAGERTDIFGLRGTLRRGPVSLELEPVYESGRVSNADGTSLESISAWGGHLDLSVDAELAGMKNTFAVGYAYGSGSQEAADGGSIRKQSSNPDNDSSIMGDMGFIPELSGLTIQAPDGSDIHGSGLQIFTLGWGINLLKDLNFSATSHYFVADHTPAGISRKIGLETDFILTWNLAENMALIAAYDRLFTAGFFRSTGHDNDLHYGYLMFQFNIFGGRKRLAKG